MLEEEEEEVEGWIDGQKIRFIQIFRVYLMRI